MECIYEIFKHTSYLLSDQGYTCYSCEIGYKFWIYTSTPADVLQCVPNLKCAAEDGTCLESTDGQDQS